MSPRPLRQSEKSADARARPRPLVRPWGDRAAARRGPEWLREREYCGSTDHRRFGRTSGQRKEVQLRTHRSTCEATPWSFPNQNRRCWNPTESLRLSAARTSCRCLDFPTTTRFHPEPREKPQPPEIRTRENAWIERERSRSNPRAPASPPERSDPERCEASAFGTRVWQTDAGPCALPAPDYCRRNGYTT